MRNIQRALLLTATFALVLGVTASATAGPSCDKLPPDHPQCTLPIPDHPDGLTCAEAGYGGYDEAQTLTDGTDGTPLVVGAGRVCVDWTTTEASEWVVTVTDSGGAKGVIMSLRDSHPGDFCWQGVIDVKRGDTELTMAHTMGPNATGGVIPMSVIDACGLEYTDSAASYVLIVELSGKPTTAKITIEPAD